jgi:probable rRNA maturation factor
MRRRPARRARSPATLQLQVRRRVRAWSPTRRDLTRWVASALGRGAAGGELGLAVVGAPESRRLNAQYRGRDCATNVLSFPAPLPPRGAPVRALGDLVICARVLRAEARAQAKTLRAHWAHLVVHGTLHLLGYDHERDADARRMERREIAVLRRLGFANPYRRA